MSTESGGASPPVAGDGAGAMREGLPTARVEPPRRASLVWIVPALALLAGVFLVYQSFSQRGRTIRIRFETGGGIQVNDPVMFRGTPVGRVRTVALTDDLAGVTVTAELRPDASPIAVQGSKFWIVQPVVSMSRVSGLETLLGPKYIEVDPGPDRAAVRSEFVGLEREPVMQRASRASVAAPDAGGGGGGGGGELTLYLNASVRPTVNIGSPVLYRGVKVGSVIAFDLSKTGQTVDIGVVIEAAYAHLVRSNTVFYNASGVDLAVGLSGLALRAPSLESVLSGGVEFATPATPGTRVQNGTAFKLEAQPPKGAGEWSPDLSE
jgi:paraquat-inducible protein B